MSVLRIALALALGLASLSCGSGGGGTGSSSSGSGSTAALDGVWEITAAGHSAIGPSEMTISSGTVTGVIVEQDEGKGFRPGCTHVRARSEFSLRFEGNTLSGTIT